MLELLLALNEDNSYFYWPSAARHAFVAVLCLGIFIKLKP